MNPDKADDHFCGFGISGPLTLKFFNLLVKPYPTIAA
jgi:hypothetical protein